MDIAPPPRLLAIVNQKGGVGKTTCAINIAAGLSRLGFRVLLADLDPQANLTTALGISAAGPCLADLVGGKLSWKETAVCHGASGITVLPSSVRLASAEIGFAALPAREMLLRQHLLPAAGNFDYALLDCPPALGLLTINALVAAHGLIIPVLPEFLSLQGLSQINELQEVVRQKHNPGLAISGIILNRFDRRKSLHREVLRRLQEHFGSRVLQPAIRDNIALAEAPGYNMDIFSYRPDSIGAQDYLAICQELVRRCPAR